MDKIKTVKIKNPDGSVSEETYTISVDAKDVDMANGKELQETIGTIDIDTDGNVAEQLENLNENVDNLNTDIKKKAYYFNTVADMKAVNLKVGDYACTLGYYEANDGGAGDYQIISGTYTDDGGSYHKLKNNLFAKLIVNNTINIKQFGVKSSTQIDNTSFFTKIINYCNINKKNIFMPNGTYIVSDSFTIQQTYNIIGENKNNTKIVQNNINKEIFINAASYVTIKNICFNAPENYTSSLIKLTTASFHIWDLNIINCVFNGTNYTGRGIELAPNSQYSYGYMNTVIEKNNFHNLYEGIYINLMGSTWANCGVIKDCWIYSTEYGFNMNTEGNGIGFWNFINFSGQYDSVTTGNSTLIRNLMGNRNKIDTCILYDGGYGVILTPKARYTTIINCQDGYFQIRDLGYMTNIIDFGENVHSTYYELIDQFIGPVTIWNKMGSQDATMITKGGGGAPYIELSTGENINNQCIMNLNEELIYGRGLQARQCFRLKVPTITNLKFYLGIGSTIDNRPIGSFIKFDTTVDNKLHFVQKIYNQSEPIDETLNITLEADTWYTCQIIRDNYTDKVYLWINNALVAEIENTNNYHADPYFSITTLDTDNKKLQISNLSCRTYHYNH